MAEREVTSINRSIVLDFLRQAGFDPGEVTEVQIDPTRVVVRTFDLDDNGNVHIDASGADIATNKTVLEVLADA